MNVDQILLIFCQYGFRKASMEDLARAADLSRQSLYKKFGSKEGVFEWAVCTVMDQALKSAMDALGDEGAPLDQRLRAAFSRWVGDYAEVINTTPHGAEMLDRAMDIYKQIGKEGEEAFYARIETLLVDHGYAKDRSQAADKGFALSMAAKGLMIKTDSLPAFEADMERIFSALGLKNQKA